MSRDPSIEVQFQPFRLTLIRSSSGQWVASLCRIGHEKATPLVLAYSEPHHPGSTARVELTGGKPTLVVGSAVFDIPKRQIKRVADWIDEQNRPVVREGEA